MRIGALAAASGTTSKTIRFYEQAGKIRADLGDKGVFYRAMVGPFGSQDEAAQFCGSLKTAGGQCVVQRN